jgi:hypothetical protein
MNKHFFLAPALVMAGLLASNPVIANETGFELGFGVLSSRMEGSFGNTHPADFTRVNDSVNGYALSGAWQFNPNWAVDLEYTDHGSFHGVNTCPPELLCIAAESPEVIDARTLTLSMLAEVPIGSDWSIFGRLGYADTDLNRRYSGDVDDKNVIIGAGLYWLYTQHSSLALEYRSEAADIDRLGLSVRYQF